MIDVALTDEVTEFQAAIAAARPLTQAPALQLAALVRQGNALLADLDAAIAATGAIVASDIAFSNPLELPAAVNAAVAACADHSTLHDMRGFIGRAVFNLAQGGAG